MTQDVVSRRLSILLAVSFALTITAFLLSRGVSEYQAHGIADAAATISEHTLPSNDQLAVIRAELRRLDSLFEDIETRPSVTHPESLRMEMARSREAIERNWSAYLRLPVFSGESELIESAEADMHRMHTSLDQVVQLLPQGSSHDLREEVSARARPAMAHLEGETEAIAILNRRIAVEAAERIALHRRVSRTWGFVLDAVSATLAILSAYFVIRIVRRFWSAAGERMTEMEHFAGRVAHDIRSPLSTVAFALELAKRRTEGDAKTQSTLDRGIRTLQRVGQLVDGLLVFAVAGKPSARDRGADVREVLRGVIEDVKPHADEKEITIACEFPESELAAACSPGVLVSMTSNLLVNAIKYMGDAPTKRVTIQVKDAAQSVRVEVRDTGPGIPASLQARIFDPHVRGAEAGTSGFGLGLATVRRLAEAHGGTVGVQSEMNAGSIFWFELPRWMEKPAGRTPGERTPSSERAVNSLPSPAR